MPTQDYTVSASDYNLGFSSQNRSTSTSAAVTANTQWDRDNLLHFIEENFKSEVRGGVKLENLRAFLHVLVKSARIQKDDSGLGVLISNSFQISSSAANRYYFGNQTYGFAYHNWSQINTQALSATTLPSIASVFSNMGVNSPFEFKKFFCRGSVANMTSTGVVDIKFYYADDDNNAASLLANVVYVGTAQVNCAVTDTAYSWAMSSVIPIPAGKKIFMFVRNTGYASSTEFIRVSYTMYFELLSESWTTS